MIIMKYAKYIACLTVALLLTVELFAQTAVSGRITDKNGESVIGATILVKGTTTGTSSDAEGRYKIIIPAAAEKTLQVSYLGYKPQEIAVGTRTRIDIELESDEAQIEEVVVVGYGTLRKSDVTGAVTSVKIDKNEAAQVASFDKLLQGHAAGVQVTTGNAAPGGAVSVKIRGTSSFNGTGEPLYVVDGIILNPSSQDVKNPLGSTGQEAQNALASISPQDIASMEILKDASATAIYGSMGANGVVLITTKQGTSDTPRIEFSTIVDISTPRKHIDVLDLDQFLAYSDDVGVSLDIKEGEVLEARDWQDYTMRNAVSINTRVSVSGRSDKSNYYLAGGYLDNNGIIRNTNVRQYDFRANFDHRIAKFIKVGTKTTVSNRKNQMTQGTEPGGTQNATRATSMIRQMLGSKPYVTTSGEDLGDEEDYKGTDLWLNSYEDGSDEFRLSGSLYADIRLTKWLSFKTTFGTDYRNKNRTRFYGQYLDNGLNGRAGFSELVAFRYNVDNMFNINKSFKGGHRIDAVLGISVNSAENHNSTINAQDFPDYPALEFRSDAISNAKTQVPGYSEDASTLMSYIARMVYSYKDRYVLTATFRADGSSKFSKENRFSYFPSFSAAWRMSEEKFMKNLNFISNLKLRAGWGMVGNQGLSPYQTLTTYSSMYTADPNSDYSVSPDGQFVIGIKPSIMSNRELKWETTEQYNVGLDLGLLDNRLNMTLDLYYKNTKDLLQQISIPPSTGFSSMWINRGNIENRGVEFSVDAYPVDNADFTWNVNANISFNRNKIGSIGLPAASHGNIFASAFEGEEISNTSDYFKMPANIFIEGRPAGLFYGFRTNGIVTQEAIDKGLVPTYRGQQLQPGDIWYLDTDGSGNVDDMDKEVIGDPNPSFTYGFSTSFRWKSLSLSMMFDGVYGNQIANGNLLPETNTSPTGNNLHNVRTEAYLGAWSESNQDARYPRLNRTAGQTKDFTDRILENGSYMRLSAVTLSYQFNFKRTSVVKNLGLSFTVRNAFTWSSYSGWDPEVSSFTNNALKVGVDWSSYPSSRAYVCGITMTF